MNPAKAAITLLSGWLSNTGQLQNEKLSYRSQTARSIATHITEIAVMIDR